MVSIPSAATPRSVTILGSTGSVGGNTVDLLQRSPECFRVEALTAHRNVDLLAAQARSLKPRFVAVADPEGYRALADALSGTGIETAAGPEAVVAAAERPADWVMAAIVGSRGLAPTMAAVRRGAMVAFANKECLVCAGPLMIEQVRACGATLLPVDSEHNAIFQVLEDRAGAGSVERLVLTASGGPFRTLEQAAMAGVTPEQAVAHPTWSMGAKISVDSATMMNKGLEIVEAHYLFGIDEARIGVLVHPQSVVHSMVAYVDGSVLAQLGTPDMRTPIAHCLAWPGRMPTPSARLDLAQIGQLTFEPPDEARFPALALARRALQAGGRAPAILNAANEVAVAAFLARRIGFLDIVRTVEAALAALPTGTLETLDDVYDIDQQAREAATRLIAGRE
ncbi:MAG: 1-deoxy-D-xylulose-5-phosphate reductoisomerase [Alphaproteobacteria bacterium]|jgi:1-deoxy-D-xylulose-5-phosphate reductoisomerase|nr:1-deoxy-D-xylulose-5-phosphate reductoisomerase [Alphaproteobacteria bacterium]